MTGTLLISIAVLVALNAVLLAVLLLRGPSKGLDRLPAYLESLEKNQERMERMVREEMAKNRGEANIAARQGREELGQSLKSFIDTFSSQLSSLTSANEQKLDKMRETVEGSLKSLQEDNARKLDQMRATVDEKLHSTLEKRLGESFKMVSDRLEQVHKGLGEMQNLAIGVGDLKKVLTNVKTRGTLGEVQLENLLEQILTPEQYAKNVAVKPNGNERVEFAVKLPGRNNDAAVWLPLDAKFPQEDYQRLIEAQERADAVQAEEAGKALEVRVRHQAKEIRDKYIDPPHTTDFAILFLPMEGLYAEILRRPGLFDSLQRDFKVLVSGPTTLAALLNSLHMGFRTLAIEKRSSEVWTLLGAVKTEFGRFGDILEKTKKKLQEAGNTIEDAARKSRSIQRKLKDVQELPSADLPQLPEEEDAEA